MPGDVALRSSEHRELFLSSLRLAMGETTCLAAILAVDV
jgi:hypothetical protein